MNASSTHFRKALAATVTLVIMGAASVAFAEDITSVAGTVTSQLKAIGALLSLAAYVAGIGMAIMALMKFKAHKDNPQQEPLGKAVTLLLVAGALLFLPTLMQVASKSIFGEGGTGGASFQVGQ